MTFETMHVYFKSLDMFLKCQARQVHRSFNSLLPLHMVDKLLNHRPTTTTHHPLYATPTYYVMYAVYRPNVSIKIQRLSSLDKIALKWL